VSVLLLHLRQIGRPVYNTRLMPLQVIIYLLILQVLLILLMLQILLVLLMLQVLLFLLILLKIMSLNTHLVLPLAENKDPVDIDLDVDKLLFAPVPYIYIVTLCIVISFHVYAKHPKNNFSGLIRQSAFVPINSKEI
jgi:glycerol-3-phosphate acyltransferase PlsY